MRLKIKQAIYVTVLPIIALMGLTFLIGFVAIINQIIGNTIKKDLKTNIEFYNYIMDKEYEGSYKVVNDELVKGEEVLKDAPIFEELKNETAYDYSLFLGDVRIATTIQSGENLIGEKASSAIVEEVIKKGKSDIFKTKVGKMPYYGYYEPIKDTSGQVVGMVFTGIDIGPYIKDMGGLIILIIVLIIIVVLIASLVIAILARHISKNIGKVIGHLTLLQNKDFTKTVDSKLLQRADEIGELARSLKDTQEATVDLLSDVGGLTDSVTRRTANLSGASTEMASASQGISATIEEITAANYSQAENLIDIKESVDKLGMNLNNMGSSMEDIDEHAEEIGKMASESHQGIQQVVASINDLSKNFEVYTENIKGFEVRVEQINEITQVINNISEQTNLLALNAAIEAARAGEAGKGFSVVADEIRKLAEQSKLSSQNISQLILSISEDSKHLIGDTFMMNKELSGQTSIVNDTVISFEKILKAVDRIIPQIRRVNDETGAINHQKENVLSKVENVASSAQTISASCEEVAAASENLSNSTVQVADTATNLSGKADKLKAKVHLFKI